MRESTISQRFVEQVRRTPENIAVRIDGRSVTYGELGEMAAQIAGTLGHESERPVAILMSEGPLLMAAMFAAAQRGRPFAPLEANMPAARLAAIIAASRASHVLTDADHFRAAAAIAGGGIQVVDAQAAENAPPFRQAVPVLPDSPACIIYTSGSSGRPKGVTISHAHIIHGVDTRTFLFDFRATDHYAHVRATGSSASMNAALLPLLSGAACCMFDLRRQGLQNLAPWMLAEKITGISLTSSLLRTWVASLPENFQLPSLRLIAPGSEPLYGRDVTLAARHLTGDWRIVPHLSSTETGCVTGRVIGPHDLPEPGILHVGLPVPGAEISLDPEANSQIPDIGEIIVRSRYISLGYWNEPDLTAAAFSTDPPDENIRAFRTGDLGRWRADGSLEYLGRKTRRIKLRGYSIEPYEIENALLRMNGIRDAAVIARGGDTDRYLVAYLAEDADAATAPATVRQHLSAILPDYMIPSLVVRLDAFPLTARGKIDFEALPIPPADNDALRPYRAPHSEQERVLASIWQEVLQKSHIGLDDDFYDLGGASLQAFLIFARIANQFGRDLPPTTMLQAPTIAKQASLLGRSTQPANDSGLVLFRETGSCSPLFVVHGAFGDIMFARELVRDLRSDRQVYGLQPPPLDGVRALPRSIEAVAADYVAEIRKVQPKGPYFLAGYSFGGIAALEMAQQLHRVGEHVAFVGLIDTIYDGQYQIAGEGGGSRLGRHLRGIRGRHGLSYLAKRAWKTVSFVMASARERIGEFPNELRCLMRMPVPYEQRAPFYRFLYFRASHRYRPQPYPGAITIFSAKGKTEWHRERWSSIARGGLTIYEIPADHFEIVWPPHSTLLARYFDAVLDQV